MHAINRAGRTSTASTRARRRRTASSTGRWATSALPDDERDELQPYDPQKSKAADQGGHRAGHGQGQDHVPGGVGRSRSTTCTCRSCCEQMKAAGFEVEAGSAGVRDVARQLHEPQLRREPRAEPGVRVRRSSTWTSSTRKARRATTSTPSASARSTRRSTPRSTEVKTMTDPEEFKTAMHGPAAPDLREGPDVPAARQPLLVHAVPAAREEHPGGHRRERSVGEHLVPGRAA